MHKLNTNMEIDFDEGARLAREGPDAYEDLRNRLIQELMDNTSPEIRPRMQGLQWQIDQIRSTSANPMASCLRISQMMWDSVLGDHGLVDHMHQLSNPQSQNASKPRALATVIKMSDSLNKEKD